MQRYYRSGDYGRYILSRKEFEFVSRMTDNTKYNGYRVDLREIELSLESISHITCAVVSIITVSSDRYVCQKLISAEMKH